MEGGRGGRGEDEPHFHQPHPTLRSETPPCFRRLPVVPRDWSCRPEVFGCRTERTLWAHDVRIQGGVWAEFALERANRTGLLSKHSPLSFHLGSRTWAHAPLGRKKLASPSARLGESQRASVSWSPRHRDLAGRCGQFYLRLRMGGFSPVPTSGLPSGEAVTALNDLSRA